ncbi:MAG: hypothetical protein WCQ16_05845 [Verrucomicrobiae bacterium]
MSIFEFLRGKLHGEPALHPLDRRMAKRWVKQRLKHIYPELRLDPKALEQAYQDLGIEPREGTGKGGATVFEITLPGES